MRLGLADYLAHGFRQSLAALAALAEHLGQRVRYAQLLAAVVNDLELFIRVCAEAVDGHDHRYAVFAHILHMGL